MKFIEGAVFFFFFFNKSFSKQNLDFDRLINHKNRDLDKNNKVISSLIKAKNSFDTLDF